MHHGFHYFYKRQRRGVNEYGVRSALQRRVGTTAIALVSLCYFLNRFLQVGRYALLL
jgi:hypothetical protein